MNKINFFRKSKTKQLLLQKSSGNSVLRGVVLVSFWLLSICNVQSQTAPNISYATPQNYLLNSAITPLAPANFGGTIPALTYQKVSTFAGTTAGFLDGIGTAAMMNGPLGMKMDTSGNIYFIDGNNFRIRKLNTQTGAVTTIAGDGYRLFLSGREKNDPNGALASFNYPTDLALDTANNCLYVADKENDVIRKVSLTGTYAVTTFAGSGNSSSVDGTGLAARFKKPSGIAIDPTGTYLYVTDRAGNKIRRITISTAVVTTIAGSGTQSTVNNTTGTSATFNDPTGIAVDANYIYVTDFGGNKIRKISKSTPYEVTTLAGSGADGTADSTIGVSATFNNPYGLTLDGAGNLFVAEWGNKIRKITASGTVATFAGSGASSSLDGIGTAGAFDSPSHIIINPTTGVGYVSDYASDRIRKIELGGYVIEPTPTLPVGISFDVTTGTFSGTPTAKNNGPVSYTITANNYYGSSTATVSITTGTLAVIASTTAVSAITSSSATFGGNITNNGLATSGGATPLLEKGICWSTSSNPTILDSKLADSSLVTGSFTNKINGLTPLTTYYARAYATNALGTAYGTQVSFTTLMTPPTIGYTASNVFTLNTLITPLQVSSTGGAVNGLAVPVVSTFAGSYPTGYVNGNGTAAKFQGPANLATDADGNIYVADTGNGKIRKITADGAVTTLGSESTSFSVPTGVAADTAGNIYAVSLPGNMIYKKTPTSDWSIFAGNGFGGSGNGNGIAATFLKPEAIAADASGNLYVADSGNYLVRKIASNGEVTTLAGSGAQGFADGSGTNASFGPMTGIATDAFGNVYVTDFSKHLIRKITSSGVVTTLAGSGFVGSMDGTGKAASFNKPKGITVDASGNLYVADTDGKKIRKITQAGVVTTIAGNGSNGTADGSGTTATFSLPTGIAVDASGNLYVSEAFTSVIRKISFQGYSITPDLPAGLVLNADGSITGTPTEVSPATDYTITATNAGGSSTSSVTIAVTGSLSVNQESFAAAVVAYPNPFSDAFTIQLNTNNSDPITIAIYDMLGKQIENYKVSPVQIIDLQYGTSFRSGVYNVIVTQGTEVKTLRVIKK